MGTFGPATTSDLHPLSAYYTAEQLDDTLFVRSELAWYRDAFERLRDQAVERQIAEAHASHPEAAAAVYGPAPTTPPASASPARRAAAPRPNRPARAGAHPFTRILRAFVAPRQAEERA